MRALGLNCGRSILRERKAGTLRCDVPAGESTGAQGGRSLPLELRAFTVAETNERPVFRTRDQFLAGWVLQNVIRLLATALVISQAVLKTITLPVDAEFFGSPFLPFADHSSERFSGGWKGKQGVQVIGHEQEQIGPPQKLLLAVTEGFKQRWRDIRQGELISEALLAIDRDKINLLLRINPRWNFVR
jgi:hypothetical protein